jgi:hypothetical protein
MSTKHTPGPWTNHGRIAQTGLPHSAVAAKTLIARVYSEAFGDEAQEEANARLIAAAPELLEQLRVTVLYLRSACMVMDSESRQMALETVKEARGVIAKATGDNA